MLNEGFYRISSDLLDQFGLTWEERFRLFIRNERDERKKKQAILLPICWLKLKESQKPLHAFARALTRRGGCVVGPTCSLTSRVTPPDGPSAITRRGETRSSPNCSCCASTRRPNPKLASRRRERSHGAVPRARRPPPPRPRRRRRGRRALRRRAQEGFALPPQAGRRARRRLPRPLQPGIRVSTAALPPPPIRFVACSSFGCSRDLI